MYLLLDKKIGTDERWKEFTMTCFEYNRLRLRIIVASGEQRGKRVLEYREHLRRHGMYWMREPWVIDVPKICAERWN